MAYGDKKRRAERLLEADPNLKTAAVADLIGCSSTTVVHARKALGNGGRKLTKVERCEMLLTENPQADLSAVAEAVGCSAHTAYDAARRLGVNRDRRYAGVVGTHRRWHVGRRSDPGCPLCRDAAGVGQG